MESNQLSVQSGGSPSGRPRLGGGGFACLGVGLVLFVVMLLLGIQPRVKQQLALVAEAQEVKSAITVVTTTPHVSPEADLELPGDIQAIEETTINARTNGYLSKRLVDIGSRVKAGDLLAEIESPEVLQQYNQAHAQSERSRITITQSSAEVNRSAATEQQALSDIARLQAAAEQTKADAAKAAAGVDQAKASYSNAVARMESAKNTLEARRSDVNRAKALSVIAEKTLKRWQILSRQGAVSQQDLDQKQADSDSAAAAVKSADADVRTAQSDVDAAQHLVVAAQASIQAANADVSAAQQSIIAANAAITSGRAAAMAAAAGVRSSTASMHGAKVDVSANDANEKHFAALQSFSRVLAPFSGVITARNVDVGALINAGSVADTSGTAAPHVGLFGIARTDVVRIMVSLPQSTLAAVTEGQEADVLIKEAPNRVFKGVVYRLAGALDSATRTRIAEVHIDNKDGALLPGMYSRVRFSAGKSPRTSLHIPSSTLIVNAAGTRVATVTADRKIHYVPITLGRDYGTEIEVLSGLKGDEILVTSPSDDLAEGTPVKPTESGVAPPK